MIRSVLILLLMSSFSVNAATIMARNIEELNQANSKAKPGDIIILQNGEWNNVRIKLDCKGTESRPIVVRAQTPGKVRITGESSLRIGGEYIEVSGLLFENGFAGDEAVISFRTTKDKVANNCRVTSCVVDDFNNPKRMDENNWVLFYGKKNRLDHSSFRNKKNMGVLLAVILDDERSRENFHSIDNNYFGKRPPLGSNGGEIIRVGVSQHCQFNSNTGIINNEFEECDGETEIISIKSGSNVVKGNIFFRCQGSVVLRHGDNNTVVNNRFLGYGKPGTGGVRVINKGQWVINNYFYECRGTSFRSPIAVMNGIPNSPAHRYVQVQDAVIANNSFFNCAPMSFGEGSDTERTLPPVRVLLANNIYYNTKDSIIYKAFDKLDGFRFVGNNVHPQVSQTLVGGFSKKPLSLAKIGSLPFPQSQDKQSLNDIPGLNDSALRRLFVPLPDYKGYRERFAGGGLTISGLAGAKWFITKKAMAKVIPAVRCATDMEVYAELAKNRDADIILTGADYIFHRPLEIKKRIKFKGTQNFYQDWHSLSTMQSLFVISGNGNLILEKLNVDGSDIKARHFISNDTAGPSSHFNLLINQCQFRSFSKIYGTEDFFHAFKSSIADSIVITSTHFQANTINLFNMADERDDKGYYNAEKIRIENNTFVNHRGMILDLYRGGNDESTLGPDLYVAENNFDNCKTENNDPLIRLLGVQKTQLFFNSFIDCNPGKILLSYRDLVRAQHLLTRNIITRSGQLETNTYVIEEKNSIQ